MAKRGRGAGCFLVFPILLLILLVWCRSKKPVHGEPWRAGLDRYDYLESVHFSDDERGDVVLGWDQFVRFEARFRYVERRDTVEIEYLDGDFAGEKKTVGFEVDEGDYRFEEPGPAGTTFIRCRERAVFDASPFPAGTADAVTFYRSCTTSR
jgi:hypothetical protein